MDKWKPIDTAPLVALSERPWRSGTPMILTCVRGDDGLPLDVQTNRQVEGHGWLKPDDWTHWMEIPVEFEESSDEF